MSDSRLPPASSPSTSSSFAPHLAMVGPSDLPPGFQFFPSDEELVVHFLRRKASLHPCQPDVVVPEVLPNQQDPWELDGKALQAGNQWYFFSHATQSRVTPNGYWNPVCDDEMVSSGGGNVGIKRTLVFSLGRPCGGTHETNWVMHEYHLLDGSCKGSGGGTSSSSKRLHKKKSHSEIECNNWVICRVFDSSCGSQVSFQDEGMELSCLDEVFLSLDDYDEVSLPNK